MSRLHLLITAGLAAAAASVVVVVSAVAAASAPEVKVFARIASPGYPADALVAKNGTVYVGTFHSFTATSDNGPSKVFAFTGDGRLARTYTITGQTPGEAHGVQVAATDRDGLLYLLDQAPARILRLNPVTGAQSTWATFSSVPACPASGPTGACTEGSGGSAPEPDFATWGPDGSLYVTDYAQSLIWRVPPAGGKAIVWFTDPRLNGVVVGPAGIELTPGGDTLMFDTGGGGSNIANGKLYTIPIEPDGKPGQLTQLWQSGSAEAPDGFAIARSGHVYVTLVGPSGNAVEELSATGKEIARVPANAVANDALPIPFDAPGSVSFDGQEILVANQSAIAQNTAHMAVLEVDVGEPGLPPSLPPPGAPRSSYRLRVTPRLAIAGRRTHFRFTATVTTAGHRHPLARAVVLFDRHRGRTNRAGRATIVIRLRNAGRHYRARLWERHHAVASATVRNRS